MRAHHRSQKRLPELKTYLPNLSALFWGAIELIAFLNTEGLIEFGKIGERSVDTEKP